MAKKQIKKAKPAGATKQVTHIYYECQNGSCVESNHQAHVGPAASVVVLSAIGTDVKLDFGPHNGSPFKGGKNKISIRADKSKHMVVDPSAAATTYPYDLTCSACGGNPPPAPPEMIVP